MEHVILTTLEEKAKRHQLHRSVQDFEGIHDILQDVVSDIDVQWWSVRWYRVGTNEAFMVTSGDHFDLGSPPLRELIRFGLSAPLDQEDVDLWNEIDAELKDQTFVWTWGASGLLACTLDPTEIDRVDWDLGGWY